MKVDRLQQHMILQQRLILALRRSILQQQRGQQHLIQLLLLLLVVVPQQRILHRGLHIITQRGKLVKELVTLPLQLGQQRLTQQPRLTLQHHRPHTGILVEIQHITKTLTRLIRRIGIHRVQQKHQAVAVAAAVMVDLLKNNR